jgi:hypothetical protein
MWRSSPPACLFGPDWCHEHEPLAVVTVDAAVLTAAHAAITEFVVVPFGIWPELSGLRNSQVRSP